MHSRAGRTGSRHSAPGSPQAPSAGAWAAGRAAPGTASQGSCTSRTAQRQDRRASWGAPSRSRSRSRGQGRVGGRQRCRQRQEPAQAWVRAKCGSSSRPQAAGALPRKYNLQGSREQAGLAGHYSSSHEAGWKPAALDRAATRRRSMRTTQPSMRTTQRPAASHAPRLSRHTTVSPPQPVPQPVQCTSATPTPTPASPLENHHHHQPVPSPHKQKTHLRSAAQNPVHPPWPPAHTRGKIRTP